MTLHTATDAPADAGKHTKSLHPAVLVGAAAALYALMWPAVPGDIRNFLVPWLDHILAHGPVGALATPFSNYNPPYLYLLALFSSLAAILPKVSVIKLLSVAGTVALAFAVRRVMRELPGERRSDAWLWLPLLPSVAVNAANFGQCDAIWSAACVMAIASAVRDRPLPMLAWFGLAVAFKAQGLFLAPFVALVLVRSRPPLLLWAVPFVVYVAALLPAVLAGWPLHDLATIYLRQTQWNPDFVSTAPNLWSVWQFAAGEGAQSWFWAGYAAAAAAGIAYVAAFARRTLNKTDLIAVALLGSCILPFFLPKMHERFFFLAEVLAFVLAFVARDRRSILVAALVQLAWALAMAGAMYEAPIVGALGAVAMLAAMLLLVGIRKRGVPAEQGSSRNGMLAAA